MTDPIRFCFGIHVHQPVGNFGTVFEQHVRDVYRPFLERLAERDFFPVTLHISGPLIEWMERNDPSYLDLVGRLVTDGKVELLLAGFYEPVLASLPRADRIEQIQWMRDTIRGRFGVHATGLWLTERVWEPDLAGDLAVAGVRFALVDDRHFLVSGFQRHELHAPRWTESDGQGVALFPIDERLRYLIPFRPPADTAAYLRELRAAGHRLAVLADDGEKFGGWPGTYDWVYTRGWLKQFIDTLTPLIEAGEVRLSTFDDALNHVPSGGLAYLSTASYREMETWSLPPEAATRLTKLEADLGEARVAGPDGALIRGSHWRNFLVKYPESNRMHKKMLALSKLCRARGNPPEARRAIGRAQCNDAYWHGVFGGLYLPHLREAIWKNLAHAERVLRPGESLRYEIVDLDGDGLDEIWIHSSAFSALVSPARGAVIEEYTMFPAEVNYADILTRRREAYHEAAVAAAPAAEAKAARLASDTNGQGEGAPSIHELEGTHHLAELPPVDLDTRALFVDRILPGNLTLADCARANYQPVRSWAGRRFTVNVEAVPEAIELVCRPECATSTPGGLIEKRIRFGLRGHVSVRYRWSAEGTPDDAWFSTEVSVARLMELKCTPPADVWAYEIMTVSKSERGLDETLQGHALVARWPIKAGEASIELIP